MMTPVIPISAEMVIPAHVVASSAVKVFLPLAVCCWRFKPTEEGSK